MGSLIWSKGTWRRVKPETWISKMLFVVVWIKSKSAMTKH